MNNSLLKEITESGFVFEVSSDYFQSKSIYTNTKQTYKFYNEGLIIENGSINTGMKYCDFYSISDESTSFVLCITPDQTITFNKDKLDVYQLSFFDLLISNIKNEIQKVRHIEHKNNIPLGIVLLIALFLFNSLVIIKGINLTLTVFIYSVLMTNLNFVIYNRYIGILNKKAITYICILSIATVILSYYIFYVKYYYNYYTLFGYSFGEVFIKLFSLIDDDVVIDFCFGSSITSLIGVAFNISFIKKYSISSSEAPTFIDNKENYHYSKKTNKSTLIIVTTILLGVCIILTGPDTSNSNKSRYVVGGYYNETPIIERYEGDLKELKDADSAAYNKAIEVLSDQKCIKNYNVDEYYIYKNDEIINIYANFDSEDYQLYYDVSYFGLNVECEWSDWYASNGVYNCIDLMIKTNGTGYSVITITNDYNDDVIKIFVDGISKNRNDQSNNIMYLIK